MNQWTVGEPIRWQDMDPETAKSILGEAVYEELLRLASMPPREVHTTITAITGATITLSDRRDWDGA